MTAALLIDARRRGTAALLAACLALAALLTGAITAPPASASTTEASFVARINHARAAHGLPRYHVRSDLVAVARAQARRMADRDVLYHNPHLTQDVRYWVWVGENVGYAPDAAGLHQAFMRSPGHRSNILDRDFTQVGIGAVYRDGRLWVAEVFRKPIRAYAGFRHALRPGSTGKAVARVQRRLGARTTGRYGAATRRAVARFQRHQGWAGHGVVGPKTWIRLF